MLRLLRWFRRWRQRRRNAARFIFEYWDGSRQRAADPVVIWRAIHDDPELVIPGDIEAADLGDMDAQGKVVAAVRRAFDVTGWTESEPGLTELECLALIVQFVEFTESLKKNTGATPTSPPPLESQPLETSTTPPGSA